MPKLNTMNGRLSTLAAAFLEQLNRGIWDSADELFAAHGKELTETEQKIIRIAGSSDHPTLIALEFAHVGRHLLNMLADRVNSVTVPVREAMTALDIELKAFNL